MRGVLHQEAERVSARLSSAIPSIEGVCLFGSVARGDDSADSDIDLLVLGTDPQITASTLRGTLPRHLAHDQVSIAYHTSDTLARYLSRWSRFGVHLKTEGEILFDRHGLLQGALACEGSVSTREELELQLLHLKSFDHLERFGGRFLFPLAHLYRIGRTVVFALLAERGIFEFSHESAFEQLIDLLPTHTADIEAIAQLRPFAQLTSGHSTRSTPVDFLADSSVRVATVRDAIRRLVGRSRYDDELSGRPNAF